MQVWSCKDWGKKNQCKHLQAASPFNCKDLDVTVVSSSVVHLAPHGVAEAPEHPEEHGQEAEGDHDVNRDHTVIKALPVLLEHQVGSDAREHKSHRR